jgi:hypothetical protein
VVPADSLTVTVYPPLDAVLAIVKVAVIVVAFTNAVLLTVTPLPLTCTAASDVKFVPVKVTGKLLPCVPLFGLMLLSVGVVIVAAFTVNDSPPVVPAASPTVTV